MKSKTLLVAVGTILLVFSWVLTGSCGNVSDVEPSLFYGECIDNYIHRCDNKAEFLDSSSVHIRMEAFQATAKSAYLRCNRTELVNYLIEQNAPLNPRRIQYHLNQKYAEAVNPKDVYSALLNEHSSK